ncbi:MAG: ethanolamine utilization protein EutH [Firmicutes bacterium]|nr:ethanolamine utilization protein EutH [Bacillota bacterium]
MNIVVAVLLVFAAIGLLDKIMSGRWHLSPEFDKGLELMGSIALSVVGLYCMGVYLSERFADPIARLAAVLPFDPSVIVGSLLCPDTGALPVALQIASSRPVALYCGMVLSTAVGVTISFNLPACLNTLRSKEDFSLMMEGVIIGLITIFPGAVAGALVLRLPMSDFIRNTIPILVLCVILALGLKASARMTTSILTIFANIIRAISLVFFAMVILGVFVPRFALASPDLVADAFISVGKMMAVVCGAMVFSKLLMTFCKGPLHRLAELLGTNEYAVNGLILSMVTVFAMLPLFPKMDRRGKLINAAFSVAGAYIIGSQMAFVSGFTRGGEIAAYFVMKAIAGVIGILMVCLIEKNVKTTVDKPEG